jgi:mannose-6-phosphate isomerase-like protein (cupin superfamily)
MQLPARLLINLLDLPEETTAHKTGKKRVFARAGEFIPNLLQIAYGSLTTRESSGMHSHYDMQEFFYFIKGEGSYIIGNHEIKVREGSFVQVPPRTMHNLTCESAIPLEFFYFGMKTDT